MLVKSNRTIDEYKRAGAAIRLLRSVAGKALVDVSGVISSRDQDLLERAINIIEDICSHAEDKMFADFPRLPNDFIDVFYGEVDDEPRNEVDREQIELARKVADELFKRKDH